MIPAKEQRQLDRLNESLETLLSQLRNYSEDQLNRQPDPTTWSPLMVAKHLMMAEAFSAKYVAKKLSFDPEVPRAGLGARLRSLLLDLYFKTPFKWKAPDAVGDGSVAGPHRLEQVEEQWRSQRSRLQELLEGIPAARYGEEVYRHPFAGRLSLSGMLHFFQLHFDRHRQQIETRLRG